MRKLDQLEKPVCTYCDHLCRFDILDESTVHTLIRELSVVLGQALSSVSRYPSAILCTASPIAAGEARLTGRHHDMATPMQAHALSDPCHELHFYIVHPLRKHTHLFCYLKSLDAVTRALQDQYITCHIHGAAYHSLR